jgi:hypothetical protein
MSASANVGYDFEYGWLAELQRADAQETSVGVSLLLSSVGCAWHLCVSIAVWHLASLNSLVHCVPIVLLCLTLEHSMVLPLTPTHSHTHTHFIVGHCTHG